MRDMKVLDIMKMTAVFAVLAALVSSCAKQPKIGPMGPAATPCSVKAVLDGAEVTCPDGTEAFITNGEQGPQGMQGAPGQDATPVMAIQLCPNVTSTYASVFPEFAICLNGRLYGTYNTNVSYQYLAALPDGAYSSNGQGAACSFTITGCAISY